MLSPHHEASIAIEHLTPQERAQYLSQTMKSMDSLNTVLELEALGILERGEMQRAWETEWQSFPQAAGTFSRYIRIHYDVFEEMLAPLINGEVTTGEEAAALYRATMDECFRVCREQLATSTASGERSPVPSPHEA